MYFQCTETRRVLALKDPRIFIPEWLIITVPGRKCINLFCVKIGEHCNLNNENALYLIIAEKFRELSNNILKFSGIATSDNRVRDENVDRAFKICIIRLIE